MSEREQREERSRDEVTAVRRFTEFLAVCVLVATLVSPLVLSHALARPCDGSARDVLSRCGGSVIALPSGTAGSLGGESERKSGSTFYVSPAGNDSYSGDFSHPWATPGYGSRQLQPGDTLVILAGRYVLSEYDGDIIVPQTSGTADAWITIRGETGNRPILAGANNLIAAIDITGISYVRIENLEITSDNGAPFRDGIDAIGALARHVVLQSLYIHHIDEFGVNIGDVDDLQIIGSVITYCGQGAVGGPVGSEGGWKHVLIRGCDLSFSGHYFQGGPGPSPYYDRPDGFGIEPSSGPIEIVDTVAAHNRGDGLDSKANNTSIHECIVANNMCDGIKLWGTNSSVVNCLVYGRGDGDTEITPWAPIVIHTEKSNANFTIVNVSIDDYLGDNYLMHVQYDYPTTPLTLTVRNTIFCGRGEDSPVFLADSVSFTMENNLFYLPNSADVLVRGSIRNYDSTQVAELGTGNVYGDPLFVSPAFGTTGDYHLQNGSPAIDAGTSTGAPHADLEGRLRPQGDGYDIGAFEFTNLTTTAGGPPLTTIIVAGLATLMAVLAVAVYLKTSRKAGRSHQEAT
jgi:hypothetical protein